MKNWFNLILLVLLCIPYTSQAQTDPDELGAWYMYVFNTRFKKDSLWGIQGDIQHRNFNIIGDLHQLLIRGGFTYSPKESPLMITAGYAYIKTGIQGNSVASVIENRFYQETSFHIQLGKRIFSNHRFRYEMRFVDNQDFKTRYRYSLFMNIPLNKLKIEPKTVYLASYNEIFINGQRKIGNGKTVPFFDRNRLYAALGYVFKKKLKIQFGIMRQTSNSFGKNQLQLSFHQTI
ncbi:MAG: hypothetical protein CMC22_03850 [Flavobacteriaceae bacterium]|nr:hypothetical protein [Flavobacteriaceae bacterium]|tara:strand:+ start:1153 stop:1851 length:699 start_codon:yes stop_codon:yes gene_type:complete